MEWITLDELTTRLRLLDPIAFVSICNELLAQAASRGHIDSTCLDLTLHVSDPDGGVPCTLQSSTARRWQTNPGS